MNIDDVSLLINRLTSTRPTDGVIYTWLFHHPILLNLQTPIAVM